MNYIIEHTRIGFEIPELLALILLIAIVVFFVVRNRQMKQEEEELEEQIKAIQREKAEERVWNR